MPKLCEFMDSDGNRCEIRAFYGTISKQPLFCKKHKQNNMKYVYGLKFCKCGKAQPSFNFEDQKIPICCVKCKEKYMIDIVSKRCKCGKAHPSFNFEDQKNAICCANCKKKDMIDVVSKRCKCGKARPSFNFEDQKIPICCTNCKEKDMINVKDKRCKCGKARPTFNFEDQKNAICCANCKLKNMIDIKHTKSKCKFDKCDVRGNKQYNGYCTHCFANLFPNHPKTLQIRKRSKELRVVNYITNIFDNFIHDKPLYVDLEGGCCASKRRIDLRILINGTILCIEVDENQHKYYIQVDEEIRYNDLFMDYSGKYIFIRYNPDIYKVNGERKNPRFEERMKTLTNEIKRHIKRIENDENEDLLEIHHLYYDEMKVKSI